MSIQQENFKEIADKIREFTNSTELIKPSDFASKIEQVYNTAKLRFGKPRIAYTDSNTLTVDFINPYEESVKIKVLCETDVCKWGSAETATVPDGFRILEDNSVLIDLSLDGTQTDYTYLYLQQNQLIPPGTYSITGFPKNYPFSTLRIITEGNTVSINDNGILEIEQASTGVTLEIMIPPNLPIAFNNVLVTPSLINVSAGFQDVVLTTTVDGVSYTYTLDENGEVIVPKLADTMTFEVGVKENACIAVKAINAEYLAAPSALPTDVEVLCKNLLETQDYTDAFSGSAYNDLNFTPTQPLVCLHANRMFKDTHITHITQPIDVSKCTELDYAFSSPYLKSITNLICGTSTPFPDTAFLDAVNLETLVLNVSNYNKDLDLRNCKSLSKSSIKGIINCCRSGGVKRKLYLSQQAVDVAFETEPGLKDGSTSEAWAELSTSRSRLTVTLV